MWDVASSTFVSRSSNSSTEDEAPNPFLYLNDSRSYVVLGLNFSNISSLKQTALTVDEGSFPDKFKENMEPFLVSLSGLLFKTRHVNFLDDFRVTFLMSSMLASTKKRYRDTAIQRYREPGTGAGTGTVHNLCKLCN